jgi:hypothetical protein
MLWLKPISLAFMGGLHDVFVYVYSMAWVVYMMALFMFIMRHKPICLALWVVCMIFEILTHLIVLQQEEWSASHLWQILPRFHLFQVV